VELLKERGADDIVVCGGGIIPDDDIPRLKEAGIAEVFRPGAALDAIVQWVEENVKPR
jgi:methylmalonyl-CoA mutase C-terminal domain/subunit